MSYSRFGVFRRCSSHGFTLLELMCGIGVMALLAAIAVPTYNGIIEKQKIKTAANDLMQIALSIERYRTLNNFRLPDSLADVDSGSLKDPWGNPYRYLNFSLSAPGVKGKMRKDHNLHPLNSEFDLYSMGPDGDSKAPLTAKASRDDVIWARDGSFIGVAADF